VAAIDAAAKGDIIVIDNGGRLDTSCWGGILANGAKMKGVSGIVVDGAVRDLDDIIEADLPAYARGTVVSTARGRIMEESTNNMVQFGGIQVRPGDAVLADRSGVVIIPQEKLEEVLAKAEEFFKKEADMVAEILAGKSMREVDDKYNYEKMLQK
jgi:regulator of RNase E activity RraA